MKKSVLEIYALAVCFVAVVCFVVALGIAGYSTLEIAKPDFTINSWQYTRHQTNDAFWRDSGGDRDCDPDKKKKERQSELELTKRREDSYAKVLSSEQRDGTQTLVKCLIIMLIDAIVFAFHWVLARRARSSST